MSFRLVFEFLSRKPKRPLIVILGPTASGKTGFSIQLAHALQKSGQRPEIVNADARQLYRGMDIGTAKITTASTEGIPHHLLSILGPREELTIAMYQTQAMRTIDAIHARGGVPLLVGGSMLYISSVIDGLRPIPAADHVLRERLSREYDEDGGIALHKKLEAVDPESALGIPRQNKVYLVRALEIFESTGRPKSAQKFHSTCPYDLLILGIEVEKEERKRRIDARIGRMFASGWIDEVKSLKAQGYTATDPGMKSHGYREIMTLIPTLIPNPFPRWGKGLSSPNLDASFLAEKISSSIRAYAKRQRTWWRGDKRIHWITL